MTTTTYTMLAADGFGSIATMVIGAETEEQATENAEWWLANHDHGFARWTLLVDGDINSLTVAQIDDLCDIDLQPADTESVARAIREHFTPVVL